MHLNRLFPLKQEKTGETQDSRMEALHHVDRSNKSRSEPRLRCSRTCLITSIALSADNE